MVYASVPPDSAHAQPQLERAQSATSASGAEPQLERPQHQAYHDPLTDLPNRSLFMDRVKEELADNSDVIAEGIETAGQLAALRELGAELGQGYLLGRPSAASNGRPQRRRAALA